MTRMPTNARSPVLTAPRVAIVVVFAIVLIALGWFAGSWWPTQGKLSIIREIDGTVSVVNESGAKTCVMPQNGGEQQCGVVYQRLDAPPLKVGDRVKIAVAQVRAGSSEDTEIFVMEPPSP